MCVCVCARVCARAPVRSMLCLWFAVSIMCLRVCIGWVGVCVFACACAWVKMTARVCRCIEELTDSLALSQLIHNEQRTRTLARSLVALTPARSADEAPPPPTPPPVEEEEEQNVTVAVHDNSLTADDLHFSIYTFTHPLARSHTHSLTHSLVFFLTHSLAPQTKPLPLPPHHPWRKRRSKT